MLKSDSTLPIIFVRQDALWTLCDREKCLANFFDSDTPRKTTILYLCQRNQPWPIRPYSWDRMLTDDRVLLQTLIYVLFIVVLLFVLQHDKVLEFEPRVDFFFAFAFSLFRVAPVEDNLQVCRHVWVVIPSDLVRLVNALHFLHEKCKILHSLVQLKESPTVVFLSARSRL